MQENHERFLEWGMGLRRPMEQLPDIAVRNGMSARRHPLGFVVVYLSVRDHGQLHPTIAQVRANIYPPGEIIEDDIHCHGFDFVSGVVAGALENTMYHIDFGQDATGGERYLAYETRVDPFGNNETVLINPEPLAFAMRSATTVLRPGDTYSMRRKEQFHSVASSSAVTIFCKTPTQWGADGLALFLWKPDRPVPPAAY